MFACVWLDAADNLWMIADNQIGPEGAKALGEGLKENKTLTFLRLWRTSSFRGWIDVCMGADNAWMIAGNNIGDEGRRALEVFQDRISIWF